MKRYEIVQDGQTLSDLACKYYGSVEGEKQLMLDNPDKLDFENLPLAGTEILIDDSKIINKEVVELLNVRELNPSTASKHINTGFGPGFCNGFN